MSGDSHPQTLESISCLAVLYKAQKRYERAEPLYLEAWKRRIELFGKQHVETLKSLNNLAVLYNVQKKYSLAGMYVGACISTDIGHTLAGDRRVFV